MTSSTVFTSNRSQAVRLPKAVAFPAGVHQVDILKIGRSRLIVPQGRRGDDLVQKGPRPRVQPKRRAGGVFFPAGPARKERFVGGARAAAGRGGGAALMLTYMLD